MHFPRLTSTLPLLISLTSAITIETAVDTFNFAPKGASYPRIIRRVDVDGTPSSTFLGVYGINDGLNTTLVTVTSTDGVKWEPFGEISTEPTETQDLGNPFLYQHEDGGDILCAFRNHDRTPGDKDNLTWFRLIITKSSDGGKTWEFVTIATENAKKNEPQIWEPFLRTGNDGKTIELYYSREWNILDQDNVVITSPDGGKTWSKDYKTISGTEHISRDGMVSVARVKDDTLIAVYEDKDDALGNDDRYPRGDQQFRLTASYSTDGGQTWPSGPENRQTIYKTAGKDAGTPTVAMLGTNVIVSFNTNKNRGAWAFGETYVAVSTDSGKTWPKDEKNMTLVFGGEKSDVVTSYPGLFVLNESEFIVLADFGEGGIKGKILRAKEEGKSEALMPVLPVPVSPVKTPVASARARVL